MPGRGLGGAPGVGQETGKERNDSEAEAQGSLGRRASGMSAPHLSEAWLGRCTPSPHLCVPLPTAAVWDLDPGLFKGS